MKIPILTLDTPNKNGRIYPRATFERALEDYKKNFVDEHRAIIVKLQPENAVTNLKDVVGIITGITIENDTVMVDAVFFSNVPDGLVVETAIKSGLLHLRSGGIGSIIKDQNGNLIVQNDYEITHMFVTDNPA